MNTADYVVTHLSIRFLQARQNGGLFTFTVAPTATMFKRRDLLGCQMHMPNQSMQVIREL